MNTSPVTVRFAGALFELSREKGSAAEVDRDVERIGAEFAEPSVRAYFADARVAHAEKRKQLERLGAACHALTQNFLRLLADKQRLSILPELATAYRRFVLRERGAVEGEVESARPLSAADLAEIATALTPYFKKQIVLTNRVEPALLAGARVVVENRMIDASAQGRLDALRAQMMAARLNSN
ncbi:MAG: ATP synthase F1 subunit delta [Planctomycetes bacterium]|nr:ATP synthase F1 subunit delta [Planctomycetota bacterium]